LISLDHPYCGSIHTDCAKMRQQAESVSGNSQKAKECSGYSHRITNYFWFLLKPRPGFDAPCQGENFPGVLLQSYLRPEVYPVKQIRSSLVIVFLLLGFFLLYSDQKHKPSPGDAAINQNAVNLTDQGRDIFRHDTFGDEDFWGGTLHLHQAI